EREAEVGDEPEGGAFDDEVERLKFSQEEAFFVEVELGVGRDEKGGAEQQERQGGTVAGVGHVEADGADWGLVAQPVAEGESEKGDQGVAGEKQRGEVNAAQAGGGGHGAGGRAVTGCRRAAGGFAVAVDRQDRAPASGARVRLPD